jgi:hypothetical protein
VGWHHKGYQKGVFLQINHTIGWIASNVCQALAHASKIRELFSKHQSNGSTQMN